MAGEIASATMLVRVLSRHKHGQITRSWLAAGLAPARKRHTTGDTPLVEFHAGASPAANSAPLWYDAGPH